MSVDKDPQPRVPNIENPQPETPLTEDFTKGTANDPNVDVTDSQTTITVDGEEFAMKPGATVLDALETTDAGEDVPADVPRLAKPFRQRDLAAQVDALLRRGTGARGKLRAVP